MAKPKQINCPDTNCPNYGRYNRYCGHGEAVIAEPEPIAKVSEKRDKINKTEYYPQQRKFVREAREQGLECELKTKACTRETQCVHHEKGRSTEAVLLNMNHWRRSCFACNAYVETNDAEARSLGLKKTKHDQSSREILYKKGA